MALFAVKSADGDTCIASLPVVRRLSVLLTSSQSQSAELLCGLLAIHSQRQAGHMESRPMSVSRAEQGSFFMCSDK
jgi:hypothetical protein